jgi:hypothetical protein
LPCFSPRFAAPVPPSDFGVYKPVFVLRDFMVALLAFAVAVEFVVLFDNILKFPGRPRGVLNAAQGFRFAHPGHPLACHPPPSLP